MNDPVPERPLLPAWGAALGESPETLGIRHRIEMAQETDLPVLMLGESGTGKEWTARDIHAGSSRGERPFIAISCGTFTEEALEVELFGCARGAMEEATADRAGAIEAATGGTLYLDEVEQLPATLQAKLLRVFEEGRLRRIGDVRTLPVDFRLISGSTRDLRRIVSAGGMRRDFFYRIGVLEIELPALRHRSGEIPSLVGHFLGILGNRVGRGSLRVTPEAMDLLVHHVWPGNLRELRNVLERALISAKDQVLGREHIDPEFSPAPPPRPARDPRPRTAAAEERALIEAALRDSCGNRSRAAMLLGISRITLWKRMRRLGMPGITRARG